MLAESRHSAGALARAAHVKIETDRTRQTDAVVVLHRLGVGAFLLNDVVDAVGRGLLKSAAGAENNLALNVVVQDKKRLGRHRRRAQFKGAAAAVRRHLTVRVSEGEGGVEIHEAVVAHLDVGDADRSGRRNDGGRNRGGRRVLPVAVAAAAGAALLSDDDDRDIKGRHRARGRRVDGGGEGVQEFHLGVARQTAAVQHHRDLVARAFQKAEESVVGEVKINRVGDVEHADLGIRGGAGMLVVRGDRQHILAVVVNHRDDRLRRVYSELRRRAARQTARVGGGVIVAGQGKRQSDRVSAAGRDGLVVIGRKAEASDIDRRAVGAYRNAAEQSLERTLAVERHRDVRHRRTLAHPAAGDHVVQNAGGGRGRYFHARGDRHGVIGVVIAVVGDDAAAHAQRGEGVLAEVFLEDGEGFLGAGQETDERVFAVLNRHDDIHRARQRQRRGREGREASDKARHSRN